MDSIASLAVVEPERAAGLPRVVHPYRDGWAVAPDGALAVVRARGYRVEWLRPGAAPVIGPRVAYRPVPFAEAERAIHEAGRADAGMIGTGGEPRRRGRRPDPERERLMYPVSKPPFEAQDSQYRRGVHIAPTGELWVTRLQAWRDSIPEVDVFDRQGQLVRQFVLTADSRVIGFGRASIYLVRRDGDDLEWLQRVPL